MNVVLTVIIIIILNDPPNFKESLEIVNLSKCHSDEQERLKNSPPDDTRVCIIIN